MKAYLAELVGTFVLVMGGVGSAVLAGSHIGFMGVAFAFGLSLLAMVYAIGPISGCHVNPAVTLGLFLAGKFPASRIPGYWIAQILGALLAAAVIYVIACGNQDFSLAAGFGSDGYGDRSPDHYSMGAAFVSETVMTAFLVLTVLGATDDKAPVGFAGLAIGLVLTLIHLVSIPVDNTSVNPARSIGPALFAGTGAIEQLWLFIVAPLLGAAIAAGLYAALRTSETTITASEGMQALPTEQIERTMF
ncbi:aquaporin Z [Acidomonas methanolica]|uniref:aquaporin Z n=1 Tax=Acidomonas methanolica TaxID=437 RepID=UPI002119F2F1|nr:aquaporin Z [Acidomonas methanolica]MCQ9154153.1 aquaporin Z [Acidomonas methanolica]